MYSKWLNYEHEVNKILPLAHHNKPKRHLQSVLSIFKLSTITERVSTQEAFVDSVDQDQTTPPM